jgi:hypothetical protein
MWTTARAAKQMSCRTNHPSSTIHRCYYFYWFETSGDDDDKTDGFGAPVDRQREE